MTNAAPAVADPSLAQIVMAIVTLVSAVLAWWQSRQNTAQIRDLRVDVNGRLSQLLDTTKVAATAVGKLEGKAEEKAVAGAGAQIVSDAVDAANKVLAASEKIDKAAALAKEVLDTACDLAALVVIKAKEDAAVLKNENQK